MGIILFGTILRKEGYKIKVWTRANDIDYVSKLDKIIEEQTPLFMGFSGMVQQMNKA